LDFQKIKLKERVIAKNIFESEKGQKIIEDMINKKFIPEEDEEYLKAIEKDFQDENKKKMIYVSLSLLFRI
jgi:hypothetical protein